MSLQYINSALNEHQRVFDSLTTMAPMINECANRIHDVFAAGGRVFICGNGGSAADAQHFASELTGRFEKDRRGFPALALTTDTSALTAIGNDYGFEEVFARQLHALGQSGDLLIAISTSGHSLNVVKAVEYAQAQQIFVVALLGKDGGQLVNLVDIPLTVAANRTARIQEAHIFILHLLCELFETKLKW